MIKDNKTITSLLLIAVIAIYGTIVFRSFVKPEEDDLKTTLDYDRNSVLATNYLRDTFKIDSYLNDPFNSEQSNVASSEVKNVKVSPLENKPVIQKPVIQSKNWPIIKYYGFVKQVSKSSELSLVSINNKILKMKSGQTSEGITLVKSLPDSAIFLFNGQTKSIKK